MTDSYRYKLDAFADAAAIHAVTAPNLLGATAVTHFTEKG